MITETIITMGGVEMELIHAMFIGAMGWGVWVTRGLFKINELATKIELLEVKADVIEEIRKLSDPDSL